MNVFVVVQTSDIELIGLDVFQDGVEAARCFDELCGANQVIEDLNLTHELPGTLRIAGDDAYAVQLIQRQLSAR
jgi:hypothetical protein